MKSIRWSLLGYLLLLLVLTLGAFSFLIYQNARDGLSDTHDVALQELIAKHRESHQLLQESYDHSRQTLTEDFDRGLRNKARAVASLVTWAPSQDVPDSIAVFAAGAQTIPFAPLGNFALFPLQVLPNALPELTPHLRRKLARLTREVRLSQSSLKLQKDASLETLKSLPAEYFEIYDGRGTVVHVSNSLGNYRLEPGAAVPPGRSVRAPQEVTLPRGNKGRQLVVKLQVSPRNFPVISHLDEQQVDPLGPAAIFLTKEAPGLEETRTVVVHYAKETAEMDALLANWEGKLQKSQEQLRQTLNRTRADLNRQAQVSLSSLQRRLLVIGVLVLGVAVAGGIYIVHRGLVPLDRLTQAVSHVSERDFDLHLDEREFPVELLPVVEKLKDSLASLKRAFNREQQAAADISHELRTPIAALLANAQVCLRKSRSPEEYRTTLTTCTDIARQLNVLVERLLALARLDSSTDQLKPTLVDVPDLAEKCLNMVRPLGEGKALQMNVHRNGPAYVRTNQQMLREVILNLLHNAIHYNRPNGTVELAIYQWKRLINLEVRDTGIGIPADQQSHLFERFYRVDASRQSDGSNCGLGLAIVKGYLDAMQGQIAVESVEGRGTTFRVTLPAETA